MKHTDDRRNLNFESFIIDIVKLKKRHISIFIEILNNEHWTLFGLMSTVLPLFRTKRWRICCHLLHRGDLRRLNIRPTKKTFSAGALPRPHSESSSDALIPDPRLRLRRGKLPPHSAPLSPRDTKSVKAKTSKVKVTIQINAHTS